MRKIARPKILGAAVVNSTSQRISADGLFDCLFSTYSKGAIDKFRDFLSLHPFVTKWLMSCDFVINEAEATNDAYVYTFFPHNEEIIDRKDKIKKLVPRDFKKTKEVTSELKDFFRSGETFSICLLTPKNSNQQATFTLSGARWTKRSGT